MMKVAFGTVVYELAYKFHDQFINTINFQDAKEFDVLLLNDDLSNEKYNYLKESIERDVIEIESKVDSTIPELRIQLIREAKEKGYDLLVLGDFDDVISNDRVSRYISNFDSQYSFFYNELYYLSTGKIFFHKMPSVIKDVNPILECNYLGLSNTALNLNKISLEALENLNSKQTKTFDWMLFSMILLQGYNGKKIDTCKTYYRVYDQNIAGVTERDSKGLKKEIEVKIDHYYMLRDTNPLYKELYIFYNKLNSSFEEYLSLLLEKSLINNYYWWGRIERNKILKEREDENKE